MADRLDTSSSPEFADCFHLLLEPDFPFGLLFIDQDHQILWKNQRADEFLQPFNTFNDWLKSLSGDKGDLLFPDGLDVAKSRKSEMVASIPGTNDSDSRTRLKLRFQACGPGGQYIMGTLIPVNERLHDIRDLQQKIVTAELSDRAKSVFLTMMGHEIQTPLNVILGFSEILMERLPKGADQEMVESIYSSAQTVLDLFSDLIQASLVDAGLSRIENKTFSLRTLLLDELIPYFQDRATAQKLTFAFVDDDTVPDQIEADYEHLKQVLFNLLSNAIKFTDQGGVSLSLRTGTLPRDGSPAICISVMDTGIGMKQDLHDRIFRPFFRHPPENGLQEAGSGIGLSVALRLATMMGGEIEVESESGQGSTFTFFLPTLISSDREKPTPSPPSEPGKEIVLDISPGYLNTLKVLVVEDNLANQKIISSLLNKFGIFPTLASTGPEALEHLRRAPYDIVFLDIQLSPEMDGLEVSERIRRDLKLSTYIVGISADRLDADQEFARESGMNAFFSKPFNQTHLETVLKSALKELRKSI